MPRCLSMTNLLVALVFSAASGFSADIGATLIRQPGASLDTSLRNELDHAVDLATEWLAAHQNADGSWGSETDRVSRTSIALLALTARTNLYSDACARAAVWVDAHPPSDTDASDAYAWRMIALLSAAANTPGRSDLTQRLINEALPHAPTTNTWFFSQLLWNDALALAGQRVRPLSTSLAERKLQSYAADWPPLYKAPYCIWLPTHLINRRSNGVLERNGTQLDWRRDIAQNVINSQRRDPAGGGYWGQSEGDDHIRETAFGILTLLEL